MNTSSHQQAAAEAAVLLQNNGRLLSLHTDKMRSMQQKLGARVAIQEGNSSGQSVPTKWIGYS